MGFFKNLFQAEKTEAKSEQKQEQPKEPPKTEHPKGTTHKTMNVRGVHFRQKALKKFKNRDPELVEFVPEPDNPEDKNAIKILFEGELVGYVPREKTGFIKSILDENRFVELKARTEISEKNNGEIWAKFTVYYLKQE